MNGKTAQCKVCGEPYKVYAFSAADQTACPKCVRRAEANMRKPSTRDAFPVDAIRRN